eukprot:TRINITY_DN21277_c0_g1_i1.p1 TRINITY_DN21277_c0_g1~~TRINITY_DN21277_c0_g1_i1.p1  ORF type:complete len:271 (-),score=33.26 TRINITY_DN21277_c0_g1_i1:23-835(-)
MKPSPKPISSPNRPDKFPPPLTRFLRTNGGSRSRGRCRSSPMFSSVVRKKNIETQEPSSPKVTCMGQVRIRRPKKSTSMTGRGLCKWLQMALLCNPFSRKRNPCRSRSIWRKWFGCYQRKKTQVVTDSEKPDTETKERDEEDEDYDDEEEGRVFITTPPKNALLLMRCRSEPRGASSLANRFWASPCVTEEAVDNKIEQNDGECEEDKPVSDTEREEKVRTMVMKSSSEPLILTRCKSEPASRTARLSLEAGFWKDRRLGVHQSTAARLS